MAADGGGSPIYPVYLVGPLALDTGAMRVTGPRGEAGLSLGPYRVLERLMRRPGVLVSASDLVLAMYGEDEPDSAENCLRHQIRRLKGWIDLLAGQDVLRIRNEPGVGYAIEMRPRRASTQEMEIAP